MAIVVAGTTPISTSSDNTGSCCQSHLIYATNQGRWWYFFVTGIGVTQTGISCRVSSSNDLSTATWSDPTNNNSPTIASGFFSSQGRNIAVGYANIASTDVVHIRSYNGGNNVYDHIRATITGATTITWGAWVAGAAGGSTVQGTHISGPVLGIYSNAGSYYIHATQEKNARAWANTSTTADTGSAWTSGWATEVDWDQTATLGDSSIQNNIFGIADLGAGTALAVSQLPAAFPNTTGVDWAKSNSSGVWSAGSQAAIFTDTSTQDQNDWGVVGRTTSDVHAIRRTAATTFEHQRFNGTSWSTGDTIPSASLAGHLAGSGVFMATDGTFVWAFIIDTDANNSVKFTKWTSGTGWSAWVTLPTNANVKHFISGYQLVASTQINVIWTENTSTPWQVDVGSFLTTSGYVALPAIATLPTQQAVACTASLSALAAIDTLIRAKFTATASLTFNASIVVTLAFPAVAAMAATSGQRIFPVSDTSVGNWTNQAGSKTNLWQAINSELDQWTAAVNFVNLDPPGISNDPNNPANNFGYNSIVIDPFTPTTIYMGTNYQGLWRSTDSGQSWTKRSTGTNGGILDSGKMWSMAIDTFNGNIYTATATGSEIGVFKSTDSGVSWTNMFPFGNAVRTAIGVGDVYSIAMDPFLKDHLVCSFHSPWTNGVGTGLIETTNGGTSWVERDPPFLWAEGAGVYFGNDSNTWIVSIQQAAGGNTDGNWITRNASTSWTKFSTINLTHGGTEALYRDPATGTLVFAANTTVLRSTDSGSTWNDIGTGLPGGQLESIASDGTTMWTAPSFPALGTYDPSRLALKQKPLAASNAASWTDYGVQTDRLDPSGYYNGPVQAAYDSYNRILYTVNWNGGVWRLAQQRDIAQSEIRPASSAYTTRLGSTQNPSSGTRTLMFEYQKSSATGQMDMTVDLMQAGAIIQTWTYTNVPAIPTVAQVTITNPITDWVTPFDVRFTANQSA